MVDAETFVKKWMEAYRDDHDQTWVAKELRITPQSASARKIDYLKRGIKLPTLSTSWTTGTINVDDLNKLIEESES